MDKIVNKISENNPINGFSGPNYFLSNSYVLKKPLIYQKKAYYSVKEGFDAVCQLIKENREFAKEMFLDDNPNSDPSNFVAAFTTVKEYEVMHDLLRQKFTQIKPGTLLLQTESRDLNNINEKCEFEWGMCICPKHGVKNETASGANGLGKLIQKVRHELRLTLLQNPHLKPFYTLGFSFGAEQNIENNIDSALETPVKRPRRKPAVPRKKACPSKKKSDDDKPKRKLRKVVVYSSNSDTD